MRSKRLIIAYVALLIAAVALVVRLWHYNHTPQAAVTRDYPAIAREGVLRMITEYNQSGYYVSGDTLRGFQYELSQAIARVSGLEIQTYLEMSLAKSFERLAAGECDVIARNIPINSPMRDQYLFTDPIVLNKQVLVQRTAQANEGRKPIRNQLDLARQTLYIPKDSPAALRLRNLGREIGDTIYVVEDELYSSEQLMILVAKGDIDYAVCDQQLAKEAQKRLPELDIRTDISFTQLQSWAVRKESPILLDSLNSWLRQIKENGSYESIYRRYYP